MYLVSDVTQMVELYKIVMFLDNYNGLWISTVSRRTSGPSSRFRDVIEHVQMLTSVTFQKRKEMPIRLVPS